MYWLVASAAPAGAMEIRKVVGDAERLVIVIVDITACVAAGTVYIFVSELVKAAWPS